MKVSFVHMFTDQLLCKWLTRNLIGEHTCTSTLVPEVFFHWEETREERERSGERKPLVAGDAFSLSCYDRCDENRLTSQQPITTHLSVNNSQSEYTYKVPPIRRQGQLLTLVQIYWCNKVSQLPWATRGFLTFSLFSSLLFSPLCGSSLRKPLVPRVMYQLSISSYMAF